ncbi:MAG: hypothetical protein Q8N23_04830 [Archangium sp.]|nr:hypothetical protein [Archangium sp.]MDP3151969.1 hypothetical protein [Archangium sp.]MDP3571382.1 hypothetical protein [Archangium sp.]
MTLSALLGQYGTTTTVNGFTKDGAFLVGSTRDESLTQGTFVTTWYQSTVTGDLEVFTPDDDGNPDAEFTGWLSKHPIGLQPIAGRTSPDGLVTIDIVLERGGSSGDSWAPDTTWRVLARWKDRVRFLKRFTNATRCEIEWLPSSRAVLIWTESSGYTMGVRGASLPTQDRTVDLWPIDLPVINVAGADPKKTEGVIKKLPDGPRYVPSTAVKKRPATVVYFAPGQEPRARLLLPYLPGATLAPLDWVAPYDVVVALGGT